MEGEGTDEGVTFSSVPHLVVKLDRVSDPHLWMAPWVAVRESACAPNPWGSDNPDAGWGPGVDGTILTANRPPWSPSIGEPHY